MLIEKLKKFEVVLASGSPRRKQLLSEMDIPFRVETKPVEEKVPPSLPPVEAALYLSRLKAAAFPGIYFARGNKLLITADTVVALGNEILGKPQNMEDAQSMLRRLSGKTHRVITAVTLRTAAKQNSFATVTKVTFKKLNKTEILYYLTNYKPFDKAGAYGIQEWIGHVAIEKVEGSYFNVVGLPTRQLYQEMMKFIDELS